MTKERREGTAPKARYVSRDGYYLETVMGTRGYILQWTNGRGSHWPRWSPEHDAANNVVGPAVRHLRNDGERYDVFSTEEIALQAIDLANAAILEHLRANPEPSWAEEARAAGWTPPSTWKW